MHPPTHGMSRRGLLRAASVAVPAALLGAAGGGAAWAARSDDHGADGAPAGDERFADAFEQSAQLEAAAVETSYNGWQVGTPASAIDVTAQAIPGTSLRIEVKSGDVGTVLTYLAARFHAEVEPLRLAGGYSYRRNVNNTSVWSNHASGTAIDLNWDKHPNGAKGTFTSAQVAAIRNILATLGSVVYWGGDYRGTTDEMHFEINVGPSSPALPALAARIGGPPPDQLVALRAVVNGRFVVAENAGASPLIANRTSVAQWEQFGLYKRGGSNVAFRSMANDLFVCSESGGAGPLVANRTAVDTWETFELIRNSDGTVSLRARSNGRVVTAESAGAGPLLPNRTAIDQWEKFELITL